MLRQSVMTASKRKMGRRKAALNLTDDERETLERYAHRRTVSAGLAQRARIVLLCADGILSKDVAAEVGVSQQMVCKWRKRFLQARVDGLCEAPRPNVHRRLSDEKVEQVIQLTLHGPPEEATHWSTRLMEKKTGVSRSTISRNRRQPALPMVFGQPERVTPTYIRNGTTTLFAALDVATGKVIGECHEQHRSIEFRKFLNTIDKEVPAELTQRQIKRGIHRSTAELEAAINDYIERSNHDPKPFVWTKTADQIIASVARLCQRTLRQAPA